MLVQGGFRPQYPNTNLLFPQKKDEEKHETSYVRLVYCSGTKTTEMSYLIPT